MNPGPASASLKISIDPQTVYISNNSNQTSYAPSIAVTVQNGSANTLYITKIAVTLPGTLTPNYSFGSLVANPAVLWSFNPSQVNEGEFDATPVSGNAVPLNASDEWQFSILNVTLVSVITQPSANVTAVVTFEDGTTQSQQLTVNIEPATASVSFSCMPATLNPGETSVLSWDCTEIDYVTIDELGDKHRKPTDSADVRPNDSTTYTLYAYSNDVLLEEQQTITVGNPQFITFGGVDGITSVDYGSMLNLTWSCNQFTKSITITDDTGVSIPNLFTNGNTVEQGTITVGPIVTPTTFQLTGFGNTKKSFFHAPQLININDVSFPLTASPDSNIWELDAVTLSWNISSVASVDLSPALENGPSMDNLVGHTTINPQENVIYTLTVTGFKNNNFGKFSTQLPLTVQQVSITSFTKTPNLIVPYNGPNSCTLNWETVAQVVSINNNIGNVVTNSSLLVTAPDDGAVYTLTAGTFQNPNLAAPQSITIVNAYGPYIFTNFQSYDVSLKMMTNQSLSIAYLREDAIDFGVILGGVTITTNPVPPSLVAMLEITGPGPLFTVFPWPFNRNGPPLTIAWADPNKPSGTITLQVLPSVNVEQKERQALLKRLQKKRQKE